MIIRLSNLSLAILAISLAACVSQPAPEPSAAPISTFAASNTPTITATILPTETATIAASKTPRPSETPTPTITLTLEPTITLTPTPLLPTPVLPLWTPYEFRLNEFFFDNTDYPNCELPCWKGLVIEESTSDDVQRMFDTEFGFNGTLNFRTDSAENFGRELVGFDKLSNAYPMDYHWISEDRFYVGAVIEEDTNMLQGLAFLWSHAADSVVQTKMSLQDFLQQLGTPSEMYASIGITEAVDVAELSIMVMYDNGIVISLNDRIPSGYSNGSFSAEYCLGKSRQDTPRGQAFSITEVYLIDSSSPENPVTDLVQDFVELRFDRHGLIPFERVFGLTPEEVTELALQGGDNCLSTAD